MSRGLIRSSDVKGNTSYDIILRAWLDHKVELLEPKYREMVDRWMMADKLLRKGELTQKITETGFIDVTKRFSFADVVEWLRERYNVSARTAYEDIKNAKRFFLSCESREDIEYERSVSKETGEFMMWAAFEAGDFDAASKFFKELNIVKGLHEQRVDVPNYDEFIPPSFIITSDPTELGFEAVENKDEIVKRILNEKRISFMEADADDAEVIE